MNAIENFYEVRQDGKVIVEGMTFEQMDALGEISRVVKVCWTCVSTQKTVSLQSAHGVLANVVAGRQFVVASICKEDGADPATQLVVANPDGSIRFAFANIQTINGREMRGSFGWFEKPHQPAEGVFGVVFQAEHPMHSADFLLDIDAGTGKVLRCHWTR